MQRINRLRGFTLIELLVAMALMVILMTMLASFMGNARNIYDSSVQQAQVLANARAALQMIGTDLSNISAPSTISKLPVPAGDNVPLGLLMRSHGMVPTDDWNPNNISTEMAWPGYAQIPTASYVPPTVNEAEVRNAAFLQFFATTRFFNPAPTVGLPRFEQRPALIQYYLRKRLADSDGDLPGAYLMRRIQPYTITLDTNGAMVWQGWQTPIEDDVCSFVRGIRVFYYDRDRVVDSSNDVRFIEAMAAGNTQLTTVAPEITDPEMWENARNAVVFTIDPAWDTWLSPQVAPTSPDFDKKMFLPPSIMVQLLVSNSGGFTYREVKQVYELPGAPLRIPRNPFK